MVVNHRNDACAIFDDDGAEIVVVVAVALATTRRENEQNEFRPRNIIIAFDIFNAVPMLQAGLI